MTKAILVFAIGVGAAVIGCGGSNPPPEGPAEKAGKQVDETAKDVKQGAKEAADEAGDAAEKAGDKIESKTDD